MTAIGINMSTQEPTTGWEAVQPARYASRPAEYLQALAELEDAWNEHGVLVDAALEGHNADAGLEASERRIKTAQTNASRIYYLLNLKPLVPDETCTDNGVNTCLCATCHPEYDPDAPIPFGGAA